MAWIITNIANLVDSPGRNKAFEFEIIDGNIFGVLQNLGIYSGTI